MQQFHLLRRSVGGRAEKKSEWNISESNGNNEEQHEQDKIVLRLDHKNSLEKKKRRERKIET